MIEHLTVGMLHTNCYIIKDEATGALAIVDPGAQTEKIMGKLEEIGGKLELILLTHGHFDHVDSQKRRILFRAGCGAQARVYP